MPVVTMIASLALAASGSTELLVFHADWAQPCRDMTPVIERLKQSGYPVRLVDFDEQRELARRHSVDRIPTYVLFADGLEVDRDCGVTSFDRLRAMFNRAPASQDPTDKPLSRKSFQVGDVVRLKSGGPPMSIVNRQDDAWRCIWFGRAAQMKGRWFPAAVLTSVESSKATGAKERLPTLPP